MKLFGIILDANKMKFDIITTSRDGHLPVIKFLASLEEVDPAAQDNYAIKRASYNGHLPVVKFLTSLEN